MSHPKRQQGSKRLRCLILIGLILLSPVPAFSSNNNAKVHELQQKTSTLKAKAAELRRKKYEKMREAQRLNANIVQNQQHLEAERRSLQFHEKRLEQTKNRLVYLDHRLDKVMGDATRLNQDAGKRLRSLYMGERLSLLQMIVEANDLSTLLDRMYYRQRIVAHDKRLLNELQAKIQELNSLKGELARQKTVIGQTISTIRMKNVEIQRAIEVDRVLRDKYRNDANFYARAEAELLAESNNITAQIRALTGKKSFQVVKGSTGKFIWPVTGTITSNFGYRFHPIHKRTIRHTGLDIAGPNRAPIKAADGGQVIWAGWKGGYGKTVMINHGNRDGKNIVTLYGHLSGIAVSTGSTVSKGQVIGYEGSTGYATGPHLHFEVRVDGVPVNPLSYL
ncbi:MAG TPA: peptidoglycan DD-metalloendopeptidase family protein [Oculatellaceae cyanobacterium]